jgi:hypothetical protein
VDRILRTVDPIHNTGNYFKFHTKIGLLSQDLYRDTDENHGEYQTWCVSNEITTGIRYVLIQNATRIMHMSSVRTTNAAKLMGHHGQVVALFGLYSRGPGF